MKFFYLVQLDLPAVNPEDAPPPEFPVLHQVIARCCSSIVVAGLQEWSAGKTPGPIAEYLLSSGEITLACPLQETVRQVPNDPRGPMLWPPQKSAPGRLTSRELFRRMSPLQIVVSAVEAAFALFGLWNLLKPWRSGHNIPYRNLRKGHSHDAGRNHRNLHAS